MPISDSATIRMVDPTALSVGSDFGTRYRIEALLGQGGMGRVYKATDKTLDRVIALKVVRQGMMADQEALNRFKQELLLASKISHTNILRIHDMGEVGPVKFISMAFVEGPDLHHILMENPKLPLERVLNYARQLAEALAAAHAEGVVHRDLKPQNILVNKDDQIFVSDFGLAKSFNEGAVGMTRTGAFMGTPRYMSPEQVEGKPADQRSDIYAYGLILYEMVTGQPVGPAMRRPSAASRSRAVSSTPSIRERIEGSALARASGGKWSSARERLSTTVNMSRAKLVTP